MRRHRGSRTRENTNDRRRVIIERLLTKITINDKEQIILALLQQRVKDDAQASRYINRKERIKKSAGSHSKDTYNEDFNFDIVVYTCKRKERKIVIRKVRKVRDVVLVLKLLMQDQKLKSFQVIEISLKFVLSTLQEGQKLNMW